MFDLIPLFTTGFIAFVLGMLCGAWIYENYMEDE